MFNIIEIVRLTLGSALILFGLIYKAFKKIYGYIPSKSKHIHNKIIITIGVLISFINFKIGIIIYFISIILDISEGLILECYLDNKASNILGEYALSLNKIKKGKCGYIILNNKEIRAFAINHDIESGSIVIVSKMLGIKPIIEDLKYSNIISFSKLKGEHSIKKINNKL